MSFAGHFSKEGGRVGQHIGLSVVYLHPNRYKQQPNNNYERERNSHLDHYQGQIRGCTPYGMRAEWSGLPTVLMLQQSCRDLFREGRALGQLQRDLPNEC